MLEPPVEAVAVVPRQSSGCRAEVSAAEFRRGFALTTLCEDNHAHQQSMNLRYSYGIGLAVDFVIGYAS